VLHEVIRGRCSITDSFARKLCLGDMEYRHTLSEETAGSHDHRCEKRREQTDVRKCYSETAFLAG
jgi:hypothetical protein